MTEQERYYKRMNKQLDDIEAKNMDQEDKSNTGIVFLWFIGLAVGAILISSASISVTGYNRGKRTSKMLESHALEQTEKMQNPGVEYINEDLFQKEIEKYYLENPQERLR